MPGRSSRSRRFLENILYLKFHYFPFTTSIIFIRQHRSAASGLIPRATRLRLHRRQCASDRPAVPPRPATNAVRRHLGVGNHHGRACFADERQRIFGLVILGHVRRRHEDRRLGQSRHSSETVPAPAARHDHDRPRRRRRSIRSMKAPLPDVPRSGRPCQ